MVNVFKNNAELAVAICEGLVNLSKHKMKFDIVLSGGNTPKFVFQTLAKDYNSKIDWSKVHLYWADERCVPPCDDESNYGMTKKFLLDFINIPAENIHRINGENKPEKEAKRYAEEIKTNVKLKNEIPCFDFVMLGLGEDGHTASIFQNQINLIQSEKVCEVATHPVSGQKRITLSGSVINNAKEIIFLVTGESKSEILKKMLIDKNKTLPAAFIQPVTGSLKYFVDEAAARLL